MSFEEKKYHIDNELASADDIILAARELDSDYDENSIHQTSVAAGILRQNGHAVGNASEVK